MIVDAFCQLSSAQALTVDAASEDYMDLTNARDFGIGEPLALVINVKVAAGGTTPTMQVNVEVDDNTSFSSATVIAASKALAAADMALGAQIVIPIPPITLFVKSDPAAAEYQYLRANYDMGGTNPTVTVDATVMPLKMVQGYRSYPDAISFS